MAKLYWVSATISDAGGTTNSSTISGLLVDSAEINQEDERSNIEDNQEIQISLTGGFSFQTRNSNFDGSTAILSDSRVNTEGATKARLVMTANTGATATLDNVYVNARKKIIESGEIGVEIDARRSDEVSSDPVSYA